ncbi:MAG: biotin--[acetyl-CoA-carboxylase] ligase [Betaproteobacteria bacterium]|nr:biotin--[acetyl-CoA-carboxylase] ligase [Betaproteobacteria bacterium]NBS47397.1 biotin--[acetyl-CoA-carboxylase] ligase [Betaproteobacteria bacterium]
MSVGGSGPHGALADNGFAAAAEALWREISPAWPDFQVEVLREIDSTNTELMRRARDGVAARTLLVALQQTAGRGRLGRSWRSAPGDSLTFSLAWPMSPHDWSGLSLAVGLSVAQSLHERIQLKWPNDLWVDDRKLGGILIETAAVPAALAVPGSRERVAVIGIGLNIGLPDGPDLSQPPACLRELMPQVLPLDAAWVLQRVVPALVQALERFPTQGFAPLADAFAARDALRGRSVRLSDGRSGTAVGVAGDGALCVKTDAGVQRISSAEVSVRPDAGA